MEDIDGGLHPAVDGQSLDEDEDETFISYHGIMQFFVSKGTTYFSHTLATAKSISNYRVLL